MTTQHNLTPWFPGYVKPVRPGVYEAYWSSEREPEPGWFAYFDGIDWSNSVSSIQEADACKEWKEGAVQDKTWRGLSSAHADPSHDEQTDDSTGICEVSE